jgi:hypothetical protein
MAGQTATRCPANPLGSVLATRELMNSTYAERLAVATFSERPDLLGRVFDPEIQSAVPEFMRHDPAGALYYGDGILDGSRCRAASDGGQRARDYGRAAAAAAWHFAASRRPAPSVPADRPDAKTIWLYREQLAGAGAAEKLFVRDADNAFSRSSLSKNPGYPAISDPPSQGSQCDITRPKASGT